MIAIVDRSKYSVPKDYVNCGTGQFRLLSWSMKVIQPSRRLMDLAIAIFIDNEHRAGAKVGSDGKIESDGGSITTDISEEYYNKHFIQETPELKDKGIVLEYEKFGIGNFMLPHDRSIKLSDGKTPEQAIEEALKNDPEIEFLGWPKVEVDFENANISIDAKDRMMHRAQVAYLYKDDNLSNEDKRKLDIKLQAKIEKALESIKDNEPRNTYLIASMGFESISFGGILDSIQLPKYLPQMMSPDWKIKRFSFHNRMATNTVPQDKNIHTAPLHVNGEANTITQNQRDAELATSEVYEGFQLDSTGQSDSYQEKVDIQRDILFGKGLSEALVHKLQPAEKKLEQYSPKVQAMFKIAQAMKRPWTGPTHAVFMNADESGSMLDANGFRPARYVVVTDNKEGKPVGVFTVSEDSLSDEFLEQYGFYALKRGKLEAGEIILASGEKVKLTEEVFEELADPEKNGGIDYESIWKDWVKKVEKPDLKKYAPKEHSLSFVTRLYASMHDRETHKFITNPSVELGKTPYGAMGADGVIDGLYDSAVATHPANLFKQLFAQITNPAIDALKEMDSFSLKGLSGPNPLKNFEISEDGKKLVPKDKDYKGLHGQFEHDDTFNYPGQLDLIKKEVGKEGYLEIDATFEIIENEQGGIDVQASKESYFRRIKEIEEQVADAARNGVGHIILSDSNIGIGRQAIPDLRILKAVKTHLENEGLSMDASVHVESQQVKDAHHYSVLKALGASTVEAPLLFEVIHQGFKDNLKEFRKFETVEDAFKSFSKAVNYEYLKIMAKFGITNNSNYENGLLLEGFGIETKGNSFDGDFNDIYSEFGGKVDDDLALDAIRAYEGAISREAAYIPLKKILDKTIKETLGDREYNSKLLYPVISKHFDALRHATFIEDDKERAEFTDKITSIILAESGILNEDDFKAKDGKLSNYEFIKEKISSASAEILDVVKRIQEPNPELVDHGRYGMRHDSTMKHRFGEEYVKNINEYYSSLEAKREPVINELMANYEEELRQDKGILVEAKERLVENFKLQNSKKSYITDEEKETIIKDIYSQLGTGDDAKKVISDRLNALREERLNLSVINFSVDIEAPSNKGNITIEAEKIIQEKLLERRGYLGKNLLGVEYMDISPGQHPKDFQIVPRDEDSRIDKEWIKNYKGPSPEYKIFSEAYKNEKDSAHYTFREFLSFKSDRPPVKVEDFKDSVLDIIQNHHRAAQISYGALTLDAWTTANIALNNIHGNPSSGEGNEPTQKMGTKEAPRNTQLASGRNNTSATAMQIRAIYGGHMQIKVVQPGAKPGEGGSAPERKMEILKAALRGVLPWTQQDSPAPLHDSYSIEELKQIVYDAKSFISPVTGKPVEVDVKIGATKGVGNVALGAYKCGVDIITIGGHEGGTAAAGRLSGSNTTQDWVLGVKALQALQKQGVRDQVKVFVEGGIGSDDDMLLAIALGYDGVGQGTAMMIQNKCIMARVCNKEGIAEEEYKKYQEKFQAENGYELHALDTKTVMELVGKQFCPVGVANSDYLYKSEGWRIEQFQLDQAASLQNKIADLGYSSIKEFRDAPLAEKLEFIKPILKDRVGENNVDFLFEEFERAPEIPKPKDQHKRMDDQWLPQLEEHLEKIKNGEKPGQLVIDAGKIDPCSGRSVGARSAGIIAQHTFDGRHEMEVWPDRVKVANDEVLKVITRGSSGLSYGVYSTHGMHLHNIGPLQNDVGKDAEGGIISACFELPKNHPCPEKFWEQEQVIAGNNIGYGNKGANIYLAGKVGSRANICAKGGVLVVEGAGEYQCEFMTSGTFINLSDEFGLGAFNGMKGGLAFQYNKNNNFDKYADKSSVREANTEERKLLEIVLRTEIENHYKHTGSKRAQEILENFEVEKENFVFAIPKNYERFKSMNDLKDIYDYENLRKTEISVGDNAIHESMRLTKAQQIISNSEDRDVHIALGKIKAKQEGNILERILVNSETKLGDKYAEKIGKKVAEKQTSSMLEKVQQNVEDKIESKTIR